MSANGVGSADGANGWATPRSFAPRSRDFRGGNRRGWMRWARLNEVDVADAPNELVWHTVFEDRDPQGFDGMAPESAFDTGWHGGPDPV